MAPTHAAFLRAVNLAIEGSELYWLPAAGTQGSALDMKAIDRALGSNTMRTMGTIEGIAAKYFGG